MALDAADTQGELRPWQASLALQRDAALAAARRAAEVPAYRASWSVLGLDDGTLSAESWERIPLLSKDALIEAARRAPPFGDRLAVPREELAQIFVAPGPLYMPFTAADMDHFAGSFAKALAACGLSRDDVVDQTTMYNWVIAATVMDQALRRIGCAVVPGGIGQSERHIEAIRDLGINAIVAFPTFLEHLLELAAEARETLPLRKAAVMGELSHPDMKSRLRSKYGIAVREFYGTADVGAVAWECEACEGMHLRDDLLVEFVAPGGTDAIAPSREQPAELVVTDFRRQAMPIIRLRTGDLVDDVLHGTCSCGRTSPRIRRIVGRAGEITKVKGMFVVPRQVEDVLRRSGVERRFRLVVERLDGARDELTLEIAGDALPNADAVKAEVEKALRLRLALKVVPEISDGPRLVDLRLRN